LPDQLNAGAHQLIEALSRQRIVDRARSERATYGKHRAPAFLQPEEAERFRLRQFVPPLLCRRGSGYHSAPGDSAGKNFSIPLRSNEYGRRLLSQQDVRLTREGIAFMDECRDAARCARRSTGNDE
jgi:hypothetical protein